jgi:hypothetical protein
MKITVDNDAHQYVTACVRSTKDEVGGIAFIELIEQGKFHISEFVLLPQEATATSVDFDDKSFIEIIERASKEGKEEQLRCSWHSHGDMDVYFSNTDEKGILEYSDLGMPWIVSLVYNRAGDMDSRIDIFDCEVTSQITISDLDYEILGSDDIVERAREDVKKFVKKPTSNWNKQKGFAEPKGKVSPKHIPWSDDDDDFDIEEIMKNPEDALNDPYERAMLEMYFGQEGIDELEDMAWGLVNTGGNDVKS